MRLSSPSQTSALLRRFDFRFKRDLGQNFLVDENVLQNILKTAEVGPDDIVLEIGAGIGTLTVELAALARRVIAIELDPHLEPILEETLGGLDNVTLLQMDAMDLTPDLIDGVDGRPNKLVANLPYGVAAPATLKVFADFDSIRSAVVMVQKEIADRILASPGTKDFSSFTLKLQYFCAAERAMSVSRNVFMPKPNVDSSVVHLRRHSEAPVELDRVILFKLITSGFGQRRKLFSNAVIAVMTELDKSDIEMALEAAELPDLVRAEELSLSDFDRVGRALFDEGANLN